MKLTKIFIGAVALMVAFGFAGCKSEDEDDPFNMITKKNSNEYTVNYTNTSTDTQRGIASTWFKHAGALMTVSFEDLNVAKNVTGGVMGLIFDLTEDSTNGKSFDVIGVRTTNASGGIAFYVSRFDKVKNLQDTNFGAPVAGSYAGNGTTTETEYVTAFKTGSSGIYESNTTTVSIYAKLVQAKEAGTETKTGKAIAAGDWVYEVYLLNETDIELKDDGTLVHASNKNLAYDVSGLARAAVIKTGYDKLTQTKFSVYTNVYKDKSLKGTFKYNGDYKEVALEEN